MKGITLSVFLWTLAAASEDYCKCVGFPDADESSGTTPSCNDYKDAYAAALELHTRGCKSTCKAGSSIYLGNGQKTAVATCVAAFAKLRAYREECWQDAANPFESQPDLEAAYQEFQGTCTSCKVVAAKSCGVVNCSTGAAAPKSKFDGLVTDYLLDVPARMTAGACLPVQADVDTIVSFHEQCPENVPANMQESYHSFIQIISQASFNCNTHCSVTSSVALEGGCTAASNKKWLTPSEEITVTLNLEKPDKAKLDSWNIGTPSILGREYADLHGVAHHQVTAVTVESKEGYSSLKYKVKDITKGYAQYIKILIQSESFLFDMIKLFKSDPELGEVIKFYSEERTKVDGGDELPKHPEVVIVINIHGVDKEDIIANQAQIEEAIAAAHTGVERDQVTITNVNETPTTGGTKTEVTYSVVPADSTKEFDTNLEEMAEVRDEATTPEFVTALEDKVQNVECAGSGESTMCLDDADVDETDITTVVIGEQAQRSTKDGPGFAQNPSAIVSALVILMALW